MLKLILCIGFVYAYMHTTNGASAYERWLADMERLNEAQLLQSRQDVVFPGQQRPSNAIVRPTFRPRPVSAIATPKERISQKKCLEYASLSVKTYVPAGFALPGPGDDSDEEESEGTGFAINSSTCDISSGFIVGGVKAKEKEFPHMAALGYATSFRSISFECGGSLISERFVLTAAHCKSNVENSPPSVARLGVLNIDSRGSSDYPIEKLMIHEAYNKFTKENDIALAQLSKKVLFTNPTQIRPACLWQTTKIGQDQVIATGFGQIQHAGDVSKDLLKVRLDVLDESFCINYFDDDDDIKITGKQICAGVLKGGRDTCNGDSGGPIQVVLPNNKCVSYIVGVTSFGAGFCGGRGAPAVYTRVSSYLDWIEAKVWG